MTTSAPCPDPASEGFYLLKPDALARQEVLERVTELSLDLEVLSSRRIVLTGAAVSAMWWANRSEASPIGARFLEHYLVGWESELVLVAGPDVQRRVLGLRNQVRRELAHGAFANLLHAPSNPEEARRHLEILSAPDVAATSPVTGANGSAGGKATSSLLELDRAAIAEAVTHVWDTAQRFGWDSIWPHRAHVDHALVLVADDDNTIDSAVSGLIGAEIGLSLTDAIAAVCEAERTGTAHLFAGTEADAQRLRRRLVARRLHARVVAVGREA